MLCLVVRKKKRLVFVALSNQEYFSPSLVGWFSLPQVFRARTARSGVQSVYCYANARCYRCNNPLFHEDDHNLLFVNYCALIQYKYFNINHWVLVWTVHQSVRGQTCTKWKNSFYLFALLQATLWLNNVKVCQYVLPKGYFRYIKIQLDSEA